MNVEAPIPPQFVLPTSRPTVRSTVGLLVTTPQSKKGQQIDPKYTRCSHRVIVCPSGSGGFPLDVHFFPL